MTTPTATRPRTARTRRLDITAPDGTTTTRLVKSMTDVGAERHVYAGTIRARIATQADLEELLPKGVAVEIAGELQPERGGHDPAGKAPGER